MKVCLIDEAGKLGAFTHRRGAPSACPPQRRGRGTQNSFPGEADHFLTLTVLSQPNIRGPYACPNERPTNVDLLLEHRFIESGAGFLPPFNA